MNRRSGVEPHPSSGKARPLFVGGPARSGTTAFADYLNRHEKVLLCEERYKGRQNLVSWDLFSFERIMDFSRPEETKRPPLAQTRKQFIERHAELLSNKDPSKLRWLGDKGPFYVRTMDRLAGNNPGARFIMLYRPIEEVAESWDSRAKDPHDPWRAERGVGSSVEVWNAAMRGMRGFAQASPAPRLLIVSYHDFFSRPGTVVTQLSRFLDLDFDESLTDAWEGASREFERRRRLKDPLSEDQKAFIREHADREAEAWVLDRIEGQKRYPSLYVEESGEAASAMLDEIEASMWRLQRRVRELERKPAGKDKTQALREENRKLRRVNRDLLRQLEVMRSSRSWRLVSLVGRIKARVAGKG